MAVDYNNIESRGKRLNPIWSLGTGMDVGELSPYIRHICLDIILEIFKREVRADERRTIPELEYLTKQVLTKYNFQASMERSERIVEGLIWSGDPRYLNAFKAPYFNEKQQQWEEHSFRFLEEELESSNLEEQIYVYKLTEESYEIIFMSHEILDELDIDIQSWVALQLIKSGNYRDALDRLQRLIIRVRKLIKKESRLSVEIKRNPKIINSYTRFTGQDHKKNVETQFAEEKERYMEMERLLGKINDALDLEVEVSTLLEKINETRELHDNLAQLVIENIKTEITIRKNHFHLLWKKPRISFKESIWEDLILQKGFADPDDMFKLLSMIFSPKKPLIYPLDWSMEQDVTMPAIDIDGDDDDESSDDDDEFIIPPTDWKPLVELWKPVFYELLKKGTIHLHSVFDDDESKSVWLNNKYAIELWNQFVNNSLFVTKQDLLNSSDQRVRLLKELIHEDETFEELLNQSIVTEFVEGEHVSFTLEDQRGLIITDYHLHLKEDAKNHA